jgi:LPXTG-motif cell wall-anchored protein
MPTATDSEPVGADPIPLVAALETSSAEDHSGGTGEDHSGGTGEDHSGGTGGDHSGGTGGDHSGGGGTGNPYVMTFEVSWQFPDGSSIPVLDGVLPDWQSMFDLAAASATGGGKPTSAHCTYPDGSTDLVCEFENPGKHSSVTDGMIVPGKPTATYTVTVPWPISGWTIDGANADSYSARDLCPRGGGGHDSGHDGGHDSGHDSGETHDIAALDDSGFICIHTVVIRQAPVSPEPPPAQPPTQDPPVSEVPAAAPPQNPTPAPPAAAPTPPTVEVLPVTVTPRALPATGNTATTTLMIGTIILAMGGCLLVLARRRNGLELT